MFSGLFQRSIYFYILNWIGICEFEFKKRYRVARQDEELVLPDRASVREVGGRWLRRRDGRHGSQAGRGSPDGPASLR